VDQPYTILNSIVGSEIHHQRPQPVGLSHIGMIIALANQLEGKRNLFVPTNTIGKSRGVWPTFVSFLGAHAFQGNGPGMVYRHALPTWDEPSLEERERAMGFQIGTTSHTKVTRLECNVLLGRGMDLNSLTWLLVTCVLFQMNITPTLIQLACNSSDATTWHPDQVHLPIFNTLHFIFSDGGEEVPCNLTQVVSDRPRGTSAFGETIITFYEST
jgi:hypothetical protein